MSEINVPAVKTGTYNNPQGAAMKKQYDDYNKNPQGAALRKKYEEYKASQANQAPAPQQKAPNVKENIPRQVQNLPVVAPEWYFYTGGKKDIPRQVNNLPIAAPEYYFRTTPKEKNPFKAESGKAEKVTPPRPQSVTRETAAQKLAAAENNLTEIAQKAVSNPETVAANVSDAVIPLPPVE